MVKIKIKVKAYHHVVPHSVIEKYIDCMFRWRIEGIEVVDKVLMDPTFNTVGPMTAAIQCQPITIFSNLEMGLNTWRIRVVPKLDILHYILCNFPGMCI